MVSNNPPSHKQFLTKDFIIVKNLRLICLSHSHLDHINGLLRILKEADAELKRQYPIESQKDLVTNTHPIYIITFTLLKPIINYLIKENTFMFPERIKLIPSLCLNPDRKQYYSFPYNYLNKCPFRTVKEQEKIVNDHFQSIKYKEITTMLQDVKKNLYLDKIFTFETNHSRESHGYVLLGSDWKIVFSGDTFPCTTLINNSQNADLLIHECLGHSNELTSDTLHTTSQNLMKIVEMAHPWRTLITHFCLNRTSFLQIPKKLIDMNIICGYDHLHFSLSNAEWMNNIQLLIQAMEGKISKDYSQLFRNRIQLELIEEEELKRNSVTGDL